MIAIGFAVAGGSLFGDLGGAGPSVLASGGPGGGTGIGGPTQALGNAGGGGGGGGCNLTLALGGILSA